MQVFLNIRKFINVIYHINRLQKTIQSSQKMQILLLFIKKNFLK